MKVVSEYTRRQKRDEIGETEQEDESSRMRVRDEKGRQQERKCVD